ncbi:MAG TPA: nuclear transport factor 2 family protein [Solirubrobacterales bacterium]|jgi:ketosteroid isomerase-like protein|nr:nuclear transport factor 2 family protein [Solirubrobacterales bacterium]
MSEQNVEITREAFEAWGRGDREAWVAMFDEESELYSLRAQLEGHPYRGHDGLRRFLADLDEHWDYVRFGVREIRDAGEQVVALVDFKARGSASGVELDSPVALVVAVRGGKIMYGRFYSNPDEALAAAGLPK